MHSHLAAQLGLLFKLLPVHFLACVLLWEGAAFGQTSVDSPLSFNQDVRPILSDQCFACHGPDAATREADLRLDLQDSAAEDRGGYAAVVAGNLENSEILARIKSPDDSVRMPPPDFGERLSEQQIQILSQWIEQGAPFETHWSFVRPVRVTVPASPAFVPESAIDAFIDHRLRAENLAPAGSADPRTIVRRLSFDLTGLPPDPAWVEEYESDPTPEAYQALVDQLLSSPHYGERMAIYWLDLVRYADSLGFHGDQERSVSPYRDYVINAFNENIPFDRFTLEQLAGDLLPDPTLSQLVASTYNRLNRASGEGGVQPKEYLAKYSADRVRTTAAVWLGTTLGCAECHDHKFDPFTAKDFYSFAAFFADIKEQGIVSGARHIEQLPVPDLQQQQKLADLSEQIAAAETEYQSRDASIEQAYHEWLEQQVRTQQRWEVLIPESVASDAGTSLTIQPDGSVLASGENPQNDVYTVSTSLSGTSIAAIRLEVMTDDSLPANGPGRAGNGNFVLQGLEATYADKSLRWETAAATHTQNQHSPEYVINGNKNGWAILPHAGKSHQLILTAKEPLIIATDDQPFKILLIQNFGSGHNVGKFRISIAQADGDDSKIAFATPEIVTLISQPAEQRTPEDTDQLWATFREQTPLLQSTRERLKLLAAQKTEFEREIPTTLVTKATTPRDIRILPRGDWMNDSGPVVLPAVPEFLPAGQLENKLQEDARLSRLDLARWLVDSENPLVARAFVNRLWMLFFGNGLSRSVDDLGSQGEPPSHPELLDWLAVEFVESGWDVQHIIRLIVESETYMRSSQPTEELRLRDPYNRLLARQARFRLDAEMVRDNALAVSGLLVRDIGGKSVRPYQPAGYWSQLNFPKREYQNDTGKSQYRRGLYTHWQRTFLHPSMLAFDAPAREECTARRERSNTPLQALVLLNDPTYVEAARVLSERMLRESSDDATARMEWLFRNALARSPRENELRILSKLLESSFAAHEQAQVQADELLHVGEISTAEDLAAAQIAAWTAVTRAVLNLHETIMRY